MPIPSTWRVFALESACYGACSCYTVGQPASFQSGFWARRVVRLSCTDEDWPGTALPSCGALPLELGRQNDRGSRALHAVESPDSIDDLIHLVHRRGHGNCDQIDLAAHGVQHAHLIDAPQRACDGSRFLRSHLDHDMRAHRAHFVFRRKPDAITHDHALLLEALDAALHAGARAADQSRQLRGRRPSVLPQCKNQLLVNGIHGDLPVSSYLLPNYTLRIVKKTLLFAGEAWENGDPPCGVFEMKQIVVVGAGKIGSMIAELLGGSGDYAVTVVDRSQQQLDRLETTVATTKVAADITQGDALQGILKGKFAVLSAAPYHATRLIAEAAKAAGAHYLDLTEDVASTRVVKQLAAGSRTAFIPQCGLAPGFITILASDLASRFDQLQDVRMRVGALPKFPSNALNYNLTWSTDGVINEYCEPCEAIVNGQLRETQPLEELEEFSLDGILYEAFNTSGGLGTLCETLAGKVRNLNYRTIRYPGHAAIMKALLNDLRLRDRRELLKDILENAVPVTLQDVVIVFVTVSGLRGGQLMQETYANKIYAAPLGGRVRSAIQITTAGGICAVLDMLSAGKLPQSGLIRQEDIKLPAFLANRFGRVYETAVPAAANAA